MIAVSVDLRLFMDRNRSHRPFTTDPYLNAREKTQVNLYINSPPANDEFFKLIF